MSYDDPVSQRFMVLDDVRNELYDKALEKLVESSSVVLDLGAGTGILGLLAAKQGAAKVYLVEPATPLDVAREIATSNNFDGKMVYVPQTLTHALLPEKVDILLSVFTGNFLLDEDLLPALFHARDEYLKPEGTMLPDLARMFAMPVSLPDYYEQHIDRWNQPVSGLDHREMYKYAVNHLYYDNFNQVSHDALGAATELMALDLSRAESASCQTQVTYRITRAGTLHGFLGWFDIRLGDDWLSTSPEAKPTHWSQVYLPIEPCIDVIEGQVVEFELNRPEFGEWSWVCRVDEHTMRHSSFLSEPVTPAVLAKKSLQFSPSKTNLGKAAERVLKTLDGEHSLEALALMLVEEHFFKTEAEAVRFVRPLVEKYGD